jgi:hypothetical protein
MAFQFAWLETVPLLFNCVGFLNNKFCINKARTETSLQLGIYRVVF